MNSMILRCGNAGTAISAVRRLAACICVFVCAYVPCIAAVSVPPGHPRVFIDSTELALLRNKVGTDRFTPLWDKVKTSGMPLCKALVSMVESDAGLAAEAVDEALAGLKACTDARTPYNAMHVGACVYDWCYAALSDTQKQEFIAEFQRISNLHPPFYPAKPQVSAIVGHDCEAWLLSNQLPAGAAVYDETPVMYDSAAALFFSTYVPPRNFHYASHMHHQGDSYFGTRFQHDMFAAWLFRRMGGGDVFDAAQRYVSYQIIYHLRPDGQQMRSGDTYDDPGRSNQKRFCAMAAGAYYSDPYLLTIADSDFFSSKDELFCVFELLFRPEDADMRPLGELPLTKYFPHPMGEMVARTGWDMGIESSSAVVHMRIGNYFFGNHQHKDFGVFQIYYKGPLAISSGVYEGTGSEYGSDHWTHYYHQTISKNGLLIFDPNEAMAEGTANDGGQLWPNDGSDHPANMDMLLDNANGYRMGEVIAHESGPDSMQPEYSYIAGEISAAYSSLKATLVTRSMVAMNTGDAAYPCVFAVFDRMITTDASFKKTWLLHSVQEPVIEQTSITIMRDGPHYDNAGTYGGKLIAQSVLPAQASIVKVGGSGKEFWVESTARNYSTGKTGAAEPGAWRIEISPSQPAQSDEFLNVLTVMDAATATGPQVAVIKDDSVAAVKVLDRAVAFSKKFSRLNSLDIVIPAGQNIKLLVCDVAPGTWTIINPDNETSTAIATPEGQCLYLHCIPGTYHMEYSSAGIIHSNKYRRAAQRSICADMEIFNLAGQRVERTSGAGAWLQHRGGRVPGSGVYIIRQKIKSGAYRSIFFQ